MGQPEAGLFFLTLTGSDSYPTLSLPGLGPGELSVLHQTSCFYLKWAGAVSIGLTAISECSAEAAHLLWEQVVAGSIPAAPTTIFPPGHSVLSQVASQAVIRPDRLDLGP